MGFVSRNHAGKEMERRLDSVINMFKAQGEEFTTYSDFARRKITELK